MITIIDYGMGNPGSILNMMKYLGSPARLSRSLDEVANAEKIILPGVGAFDAGMSRLCERGLVEVLNQKVLKEHTPILGICLGSQLFAARSEEGQLAGLGWLDAEVVRFRFENQDTVGARTLRIPHMGWNEIHVKRPHLLLNGLETESRFYFTHSYYIRCREPELIWATTAYGLLFHSVVGYANIMGVQFHPEKSHRYGMRLLKNFAEITL